MANTVAYGSYHFRVSKKKGRPSKEKMAKALSILKSSGANLRTGAACPIIFFGSTPVQRCEGRKLRAHNKRQCRNKKKLFVKCAGRKRK